MGARLATGAVFVVAACQAQLNSGATDASTGDGRASDASPGKMDAPTMGDALGAWGTPAPLTGANVSGATIDDPNVNSTGVEIIYAVTPSGGVANLYAITRPTINDPWGTPAKITELASTTGETSARLTPDDKTLYFARGGAIMMSTRAAVGGTWSNPTAVAQVNVTGDTQRWMAVCSSGGNTYFVVTRNVPNSGTGNDLYYGQLGGNNGPGTKSSLSTTSSDNCAFLSPDCLTIYFASDRADGTNAEIYMATRAQPTDDFGTPQLVADPLANATGMSQDDPGITPDQRLFVFTRQATGVPNQIFTASR